MAMEIDLGRTNGWTTSGNCSRNHLRPARPTLRY